MINVDTLYSRVEDIARKDKAGYLDPEEFNRHLVEAQICLYEYYFQMFEKSQVVTDRLRPFVVQTVLVLPASGLAALPSDYKHHLRGRFIIVTNTLGGEPTYSYIPAIPIEETEINLTLNSPIRKPNIANETVYYRVQSTYLQAYADGMNGQFELTYLRTPDAPYRATTLDTADDQYNYNSAGSTQLEWDEHDENNFVDLLLYFYGFSTRQSELIQWMTAKNAVKQNQV